MLDVLHCRDVKTIFGFYGCVWLSDCLPLWLFHYLDAQQLKFLSYDNPWMTLWDGSMACSCFHACFRENAVAPCKIGSFLCSLDNLLQKNVIVLFFGNQISKWRSFEEKKKGYFWLIFHVFLSPGKSYKNSFSTYLSHIHTYTYFAHPIASFALPILTKVRIYQVRFLFSMSPGVDNPSWFLFAPFWNNQ